MHDYRLYTEDPLEVYARLVSQIPDLDPAEEGALLDQARATGKLSESARTRLLEANLHLVISIAAIWPSDQRHILELIEEGNSGLALAVNSAGDCSCACFADYARGFIEREIAKGRPAE